MTTNSFSKSDLYGIYNVVQNAMVLYPKEIVIAVMRDFFSKDSYWHYATDLWGYPQTPDLTDFPRDAGLHDNTTTRLFIGEYYRGIDLIYYPCLLVKNGGSNSVPLSFNREGGTVFNESIIFDDGYGNTKTVSMPKYFQFAGAWEGSITIDVRTKDIRARDELCELTSLLFTDLAFDDLVKSGLLVKNVSISTPSEVSDSTDWVYIQTITLQVRSEWRRHIPIGNIIDAINFAIEFGDLEANPVVIAPNLTINTQITLDEALSEL